MTQSKLTMRDKERIVDALNESAIAYINDGISQIVIDDVEDIYKAADGLKEDAKKLKQINSSKVTDKQLDEFVNDLLGYIDCKDFLNSNP